MHRSLGGGAIKRSMCSSSCEPGAPVADPESVRRAGPTESQLGVTNSLPRLSEPPFPIGHSLLGRPGGVHEKKKKKTTSGLCDCNETCSSGGGGFVAGEPMSCFFSSFSKPFVFVSVQEQRNPIPPASPLAFQTLSPAPPPPPPPSPSRTAHCLPRGLFIYGGRRRTVCFVLAVNNGPQSALMDYSNIWYPPVSLPHPLTPSPPLSLYVSVFFFLFLTSLCLDFFCLFLRSVSLSHPNMLGGLEASFITHTQTCLL